MTWLWLCRLRGAPASLCCTAVISSCVCTDGARGLGSAAFIRAEVVPGYVLVAYICVLTHAPACARNMDRVLSRVNAESGTHRVTVLYSTLSGYFDAVRADATRATIAFPLYLCAA